MAQVGPPFVVYDCFTDTRFGGNVGAIILEAAALLPDRMQSIAREMNAPVTGFVTGRDGNTVSARFFMPAAEIAMCGHVTVGLFTHLLGHDGGDAQDYVLRVAAGDVPVRAERGGDGQVVVMMALGLPKPIEPDVDLAELAGALGVARDAFGQVAPVGGADAGLKHLFVPFESVDTVRALRPDFARLGAISTAAGVHTIGCFAMSGGAHTLSIRDFCPAVGVNETPASGTTNGALCGYLLRHGLIEAGSQKISADQGQEVGRPSVVISEIDVEGGEVSVLRVGGCAVQSLSGRLAALD